MLRSGKIDTSKETRGNNKNKVKDTIQVLNRNTTIKEKLGKDSPYFFHIKVLQWSAIY